MMIKDSWSHKWINELERNSVLCNNNESSIILCNLSQGELQDAEWLGLLICSTAIIYESVHGCPCTVAWTGNGKAHTTPWFLASCGKSCPKHLNTEIDSCPFIAQLNQKCLAVVVRRMFPAASWWTALFFKHDTANLYHMRGPEAMATSWGAAMQFCLA